MITNYNQRNLESIDRFISDNEKRISSSKTHNLVHITKESRRKCVKSLIR